MTSRKTGDLVHVDCIVVDEDTVRFGGSDFKRERTCHKTLSHEGPYNVYTYDCCGARYREDQRAVGGSSFSTRHCPNCAAKVVEERAKNQDTCLKNHK